MARCGVTLRTYERRPMRIGRVVIVNGHVYPVVARSGYLMADMRGVFGWTSVWAATMQSLYRRIVKVLSDGA